MSVSSVIVTTIFFLLGILSLLASLANWDWFFASKNSIIFSRWWGRKGARIFYGILGIFIVGMAIILCLDFFK